MSNTTNNCEHNNLEGDRCELCGCDFSRDIDFLCSETWTARFVFLEQQKGRTVYYEHCGDVLDEVGGRRLGPKFATKVPGTASVRDALQWIRQLKTALGQAVA